jgi:hypothetical protein
MRSYAEFDKWLGNRDLKLLHGRGRTRASRLTDGAIGIFYHDTAVVTFHPDNSVTLTSGGWRTPTTKDRINTYMPSGYHVQQTKGVWYLQSPVGEYVFEDNITIHPDGKVTGTGRAPSPKLAKQINVYAHKYIQLLMAGKIPAPSCGDCWNCYFRDTKTGKTMGELSGSPDHITGHMKELYYVPSLLIRAIELFPVSKVAQWTLAEVWNKPVPDDMSTIRKIGSIDTIAAQQLESSLRRYIRRQFRLG